MPLADKPAALIKVMYLCGYTTRGIAEHTGMSKTQVGVVIKRLGISRSKQVAAKPGVYHKPDSIHWRTCRQRARDVWEKEVGPIPEGFHIHHVDGDHTNNDVSNLVALSPRAHAHLHHPENPVPRWLRPERQAYMKTYLKEYKRAPHN